MSEPVLAEKQKEPEAQTLYSKSCAMVDGDSGRLLYGKEAQTALPNASTTKILTCIVAMEQCKPDEVQLPKPAEKVFQPVPLPLSAAEHIPGPPDVQWHSVLLFSGHRKR